MVVMGSKALGWVRATMSSEVVVKRGPGFGAGRGKENGVAAVDFGDIEARYM